MVIPIILCLGWVGFLILIFIKVYKQTTLEDALCMMAYGREHIRIVGEAYKRAVANGDIQMIEFTYNELTKLVNEYNKCFKKYGGHYDIRKWVEE